MTTSRRNVLGSALACMSASVLNSPAWSQQFPNAPIRVVIPTAVGGGYDLMMRAIGQKLFSMCHRRRNTFMTAAVRERIRRDVDNAHDARAR